MMYCKQAGAHLTSSESTCNSASYQSESAVPLIAYAMNPSGMSSIMSEQGHTERAVYIA